MQLQLKQQVPHWSIRTSGFSWANMIENNKITRNLFFKEEKKGKIICLQPQKNRWSNYLRGPNLSVALERWSGSHVFELFLAFFCVTSTCRSIQNAGKHSLLCDEWNNPMGMSNLLTYAMVACRIVKALSFFCYIYRFVAFGFVGFFFYIGIIAYIMFKERGILSS